MIWYPILVSALLGVAVIGLWTAILVRQAVPEVAAGLPSIRFHIGAELLTAGVLVVGAVWLAVADSPTARLFTSAGLGAITYSTINSPGYYADRGERVVVAVFGVLALLAVSALATLLLS